MEIPKDSDEVTFDKDRFVFRGRVNTKAHRNFLSLFRSRSTSQLQKVELDFTHISRAYINGMLPIICTTQKLRVGGIDIFVKLPIESNLYKIFMSNNWAHYLSPQQFKKIGYSADRHVPVYQFTNAFEQKKVVDAMIDAVLRSLTIERDQLKGLEWALNELTDNVLNHSNSPDGGFAQLTAFTDEKKLIVAYATAGEVYLHHCRRRSSG